MRVLVVGSGAREHALLWKLAQSPSVSALFAAPGNAGTAAIATNLPVRVNDLDGLSQAARQQRIDLTVVGPEEPLALGLVDRFAEQGLAIVGPTRAAAQIESSKAWAKDVMTTAGVPTARAEVFDRLAPALSALERHPLPVVVKANGLAAGKGVVIAETREQADQAVRSMLESDAFGQAGHEILLEEFLVGREVSVMALTDGETVYPFLPACDYKRVAEGDTGPNTGGMGAYAPVPAVDGATLARVEQEILRPVLAELRRRGCPYRGILYAGLILTESGPKVLEFNCRLGDPETEVVLPLLKGDLAELFLSVARADLSARSAPQWEPGVCVAAVVASQGYPGPYQTGYPISGLDRLPAGVVAFHAGTRMDANQRLETAGGRVLTLSARGDDFADARQRLYQGLAEVRFEGAFGRGDIAEREL